MGAIVTPASARLAAALGILFSVLFVAALVVVDAVPHLGDPDTVYGAFYDGAGNTVVIAVALYLVPLAGIAFLWFVVALRSVLDTLEPAPSAMAHGLNLLSGVVFVALLFAGTAALATPVFLTTIGVFATPILLGGPSTGLFPETIAACFHGASDRWRPQEDR